jgi:regulator of protease activity HflC (stomatin/prohibitin superfamily)
VAEQTTDATTAPAPAPAPTAAAATYTLQLSQVQVPIADAAEAFVVPDASGRFPIVVLTGERSRIRNEFVAAGVVMILLAVVFELALVARGALIVVALGAIFIGVVQSFIVRVPEGSQALALRRGRFDRVLPAGVHYLPPWIAVTHVVTRREIPFVVPGVDVPTSDGVRVDVDLVITFAIEGAERFAFSISAPDFDVVCSAASQDALRRMVRGIGSQDVLDLAGASSDELRAAIGAALDTYGVVVHKVVIMAVRPPAEYMASLEARRFAEVRQAEQAEQHVLDRRRLADQIDLLRHGAEERRNLIELEAANEALRLERLQSRLATFPDAARWDFEGQRLDVARALAGNDRALLSVGDPGRLTDALVGSELRDAIQGGGAPDPVVTPPADRPPPARPRRTTRRSSTSRG